MPPWHNYDDFYYQVIVIVIVIVYYQVVVVVFFVNNHNTNFVDLGYIVPYVYRSRELLVQLVSASFTINHSGDSYTQTGFDPTLTLPAVGNPLGNPTYPGYTATGGENWVDIVTTKYNKSLVFTYNYAYGGATIDATLVTPYTSTVLSLTDQVNQFLSGAGTKPAATPWTSANSLFSVFIGINDIGNSYYLSGDRNAFSDTLLNAEFALVKKLMIAQGTSATSAEKVVITNFNIKLQAQVNAFQANNTGVKTWIWDANAQFSTILDSPTTYGFIDAVTIGSDPVDFWGNNYHPSSYAHQFFGQQVGNVVLGNTIW
ncbi:hypothetical protein C0991_008557 [Blastosporella zonata]|nr:hypothetical protein C0991_008557 [Blastosporella zonata]